MGGLQGGELVANRETREPLPEKMVQAIVADRMVNSAVIIGATNRSFDGLNNTLCRSPAYFCTRNDINEIITAIDGAMTRVMAA